MVTLWIILSSLGAYATTSRYLESMTTNWTPPSKRKGSSIYEFTVGGSILMFGGVSFEKKFNDFWLLRFYDLSWERIELPYGNIMSSLYLGPRSEALILPTPDDVGEQIFYMFGGKDEFGYTTDIWFLNFGQRYFEKKKDFNEIKGLAEYSSCSNYENSVSVIYVYGGRTISNFSTVLWRIDLKNMNIQGFPQNESPERKVLNGKIFAYNNEIYSLWTNNEIDKIDPNIYKYNFTSLSWIKLNSSLQKFSPSYQPEIFILGDFLFVYGGLNSKKQIMNRILRANLTSNPIIFEQVNIQDYEVKFKPSITNDFEEKNGFWIFGGTAKDNTNRIDFATIDIDSNNFTVNNIITDLEYPQERVFNTLHLIDSKIAMFGGNNEKTYFNDFWLFDTIAGNWTALDGKGKIPSIRTTHAAGSEGDTLIIWGGEDVQGDKKAIFL
ncbi:hypothetical protein SteCoe_24670 [Stentor coeruleus]|uniref:Attractin/MKLN-like beta-propeller domain-containing protein n=1 Tax=Stentor coeruleus TaxID=5963 RepID=A0A1R2BH57_9CILI|nr:hypothetical protein SteCoe_37954 [Stentor coeruleus]OMJ76064.1 hypothetical protein SteCoe_24670 [Stentor coeruleus]